MKTIILILASSFMLFSCKKEQKNAMGTTTPVAVTPVVISQGILGCTYCTSQPNAFVVTNTTNWDTVMTNLANNGNATFTETIIDFNDYMLLAIFDKGRPTGGYSVSVTSVTENINQIVVNVAYTGTGDATQMPTCPYIIVKIPKSNKPVVFQ
ncbi:protease complex subunit PrcB family protein [Fluviicola sp.]|jgi:hypothetical protein|uniref:protease complex subunit PrcB family protein n=1 Tax=Fluviicola sp. TaxID=1917219 RepID=UPI0028343B80|nr:protease complex subunit PrcB family protein [Fluviicola sp.]MDR0801752.1 protease complex subunit PrcB family protein [Fluviicola sp.]